MSSTSKSLSHAEALSPIWKFLSDHTADSPKRLELLRALDWTTIEADTVAGIHELLAQSGLTMPEWLARDLVLAAHVLEQDRHGKLEMQLRVLNAINQGDGTRLDELTEDLLVAEQFDEDVLTAAARALAKTGRDDLAARLALAHWPQCAKPALAVPATIESHTSTLPNVRLSLLGFSTTDLLAKEMTTAFAAKGFGVEIKAAEFGQVLPVLLGPPDDWADAVAVLTDFASLFRYNWRVQEPNARQSMEEQVDTFTAALATYADKSPCPVFVNSVVAPHTPATGLLDMVHSSGAAFAVNLANRRLAEIAAKQDMITLVDTGRALAHLPAEQWCDPKLWFYGRVPFSGHALRGVAAGFATAYQVRMAGMAKVLALDLDNTLWGGLFGEDGVARLICGDDFPGNAFKAFQEECLRLKSQGMLLTILSKNNPDAITAFREHPDMVLREDDFVASRINWQPKPENIRSLAEELSLGLDSFIFLDDSPHERAAMRELCPDVAVPELPADPALRPRWLRSLSDTWPVRLTQEDVRRSDMYSDRKETEALRDSSASFEDFMRNLDQQLIVDEVSDRTLPRVAQMHMRTNQFNLTTRRFDESAIKSMMNNNDGHLVMCGRAIDKFGDHGIVICAAARQFEEEAFIESFLMSCRVIGRGVEYAFLGALLERLRERGIRRIIGSYIPSKKNSQVRDFYRDAEFTAIAVEGNSEQWEWTSTCDHSVNSSNAIDVAWNAL